MLRLLLALMLAATAAAAHSQTRTIGEVLKEEAVEAVVRVETDEFVARFTETTGKPASVEKDYYAAVVKPIASTRLSAQEVSLAEPLLRARYGKFLGGLSSYVLATRPQLVLSRKALDEYLSALRQKAKKPRCGEYPCQQGCGAAGCSETCGPC